VPGPGTAVMFIPGAAPVAGRVFPTCITNGAPAYLG
jgi:hypothetical protein